MAKQEALTPIDAFPVCSGYGCKNIQQVSLSPQQWLSIEYLFLPKANNANTERQQIAEAIAKMEQYVGVKTNTTNDLPGTFDALFHDLIDQMDCVDEATNTTLYLKMFRQRGLINFHQEGSRINRGFFFNGWPHTSAVIKDISAGDLFAVDSWFHKNGVPPEIIPAKLWYSGWHPEPKNSHQ
ncbi:MAG: hypothetical protein JKX92_16280 [Porticoccaceae bacterium]|nr:hypothetical protein [Porticoccaceae bacterium]